MREFDFTSALPPFDVDRFAELFLDRRRDAEAEARVVTLPPAVGRSSPRARSRASADLLDR